jgi:predicted nucleotidyltransferase component of viral defense system
MLNQGKHRGVMIEVLTAIFSDPKLAPVLGFKGGTALYIFYNLNRFSVDLDFDLLEPDVEEEVYKRMIELLSSFGEIKDSALKRFGALISVSYEKGLHQLKVDISNRQSSARYELKHFLGIPMRVMQIEDMFTNKLLALTERKSPAGRDVFDVYFLLKNKTAINEKLLAERAEINLIDQLKKSIEYIEENFDFNMLEALGELVEKNKKEWVKNKLKQETLLALRIKLDSLENAF